MSLVQASIKRVVFPGCDNPAISDIDLVIEPGEFIVITGPVASGKSVLCHCLIGAVPHFFPAKMEGQVKVNGQDLNEISLPQIAGTVGYMMQDPQSQLFSVSVEEDVAFGPGNLGLSREEIKRRTAESIEFVGLTGFGHRSPENLSGGEAQKAVLAGVLSLEPPVLVLDQPTAEMDAAGRKDIFSRLGQLCREKRTTIILVTDQLAELAPYATRYLALEGGKIVSDSPILPTASVQTKLLQGGWGEAKVSSARGEEIARLQDCTYTYPGGQLGCQEINLSLHQGELVALLGVNGSGKTTVARHFNGLAKPEKGSLHIHGRELAGKNHLALRQKVGFLFQNPDNQIFANTVEEEVGFALKIRKVPQQEIRVKVEQVLSLTGLLPLRDLHPHRLSRGQRQLLALASVLVGDPPIIIADEPTAGLNSDAAMTVIENLVKLAGEGRTVLWVTHDLRLAARYAHRLVAMHKQRVKLDIPVEELFVHQEELVRMGLDFPAWEIPQGGV